MGQVPVHIAKSTILKWAKYHAENSNELEWFNITVNSLAESQWRDFESLELLIETAVKEFRTSTPDKTISEALDEYNNKVPQELIDIIGFGWSHRLRNMNFTQDCFGRLPVGICISLLALEYDENLVRIDEQPGLILNRKIIQLMLSNPTLELFSRKTKNNSYGLSGLHKWILEGIKQLGPAYAHDDVSQFTKSFVEESTSSFTTDAEWLEGYLTVKDIHNNYNKYKLASYVTNPYPSDLKTLEYIEKAKLEWLNLVNMYYNEVSKRLGGEIPDDWIQQLTELKSFQKII